MTTFRRGDVVLVAFPFTDLTTTKMRPALVVSSDSFHGSGNDIILAGITSQIAKRSSPSDYLLSSNDQTEAGLPKSSLVRLGKIVTLDRRLLRKKLGHLPDPTMSQLTKELYKVFSPGALGESHPVSREPAAIYMAGKPKRANRKRTI